MKGHFSQLSPTVSSDPAIASSPSITPPLKSETSFYQYFQMIRARGRSIGIAISILLCCALVLTVIVKSMAFLHSIAESFAQWLLSLGRSGFVERHPFLAALSSFSIIFSVLFVGFPLTPLEIVNGFLFGWYGILISLPAKVLGSMVFYRAANTPIYGICLRTKLEKYKTFQLFASIIHESPFKYSLLVRFATLPMAIKNYMLVVLKVPFAVYTVTLIISGVPYSILSCSVGSLTQSAFDLAIGPPSLTSTRGPGLTDQSYPNGFLATSSFGNDPSINMRDQFSHDHLRLPPSKPVLMLIFQFIAITVTVILPIILIREYLKKLQESHDTKLRSSSSFHINKDDNDEDLQDSSVLKVSLGSQSSTELSHDESPNIYRRSFNSGSYELTNLSKIECASNASSVIQVDTTLIDPRLSLLSE